MAASWTVEAHQRDLDIPHEAIPVQRAANDLPVHRPAVTAPRRPEANKTRWHADPPTGMCRRISLFSTMPLASICISFLDAAIFQPERMPCLPSGPAKVTRFDLLQLAMDE